MGETDAGRLAASHASRRSVELPFNGETLVADCDGALYWPRFGALIVADLHLEKASAYARRGIMLPPYDTAETLARLTGLVARYRPSLVVALGDSLHDPQAGTRLEAGALEAIRHLQTGRDWLWIAGNHDPDAVPALGGRSSRCLELGRILLRHEPTPGTDGPEIAGHLHPVARVRVRTLSIRRPCFAASPGRLVMPAFGTFTGGLNVRDPAFSPIFADAPPRVWLLGRDGVYAVANDDLRPD